VIRKFRPSSSCSPDRSASSSVKYFVAFLSGIERVLPGARIVEGDRVVSGVRGDAGDVVVDRADQRDGSLSSHTSV
jgi:hypothetical protein